VLRITRKRAICGRFADSPGGEKIVRELTSVNTFKDGILFLSCIKKYCYVMEWAYSFVNLLSLIMTNNKMVCTSYSSCIAINVIYENHLSICNVSDEGTFREILLFFIFRKYNDRRAINNGILVIKLVFEI